MMAVFKSVVSFVTPIESDKSISAVVEVSIALDAQYHQHPERFVRARPRVPMPPACVAINPISPELRGTSVDQVNFPTLSAAGAVKKTLTLK